VSQRTEANGIEEIQSLKSIELERHDPRNPILGGT